MATVFTSDQVLGLIDDWADSAEEEGDSDDEQRALFDPLDIEQGCDDAFIKFTLLISITSAIFSNFIVISIIFLYSVAVETKVVFDDLLWYRLGKLTFMQKEQCIGIFHICR